MITKNDFPALQALVDKLNSTNSSSLKIDILRNAIKNNKFISDILYYVYNPFFRYHITSANCKKNAKLVQSNYEDIFALLNDLSESCITGHDAIACVNGFVRDNSKYADLIYNIIDRNLKARVDVKAINKAIPNHIPVFNVALANKLDEKIITKLDFVHKKYSVQRKLDGCRCIALSQGEEVLLLSREGREFDTLNLLRDDIKKLNLDGWVLDGEVCRVNGDGTDDFHGIMKEIKRKNHTITNYKYIVFDIIPYDDFVCGICDTPYFQRYKKLCESVSSTERSTIQVIGCIDIKSSADIDNTMDIARSHDWEGLILRDMDASYKGKRSNDILKIKDFHDAEYKVVGYEVGPFRIIDELTGLEIEEKMLTNVYIEHKGYKVSVGSGFSLEERRYYYKNPNELNNLVITVKYFEETTNKQGGISLRFPTVKAIHGKRRVI